MSTNNADTFFKVEDLKMHFPIYRGVFQRQVGAVHAVDGCQFRCQTWRNAWPGG